MTGKAVIQLGLIGAGRWGRRYIETITALDCMRLAMVASRNPRTPAHAGCEVVEDWRTLLDSGAVDGVVIATPPDSHVAIAQACIEARLPVLIEKPLALSTEEVLALRAQVERRPCLVMVDHTHLFSAAFAAMRARAARVGGPLRIASAGGNWGPFRSGVNALWDYGPHDVSMCLELAGCMPGALEALVIDKGRGPRGAGLCVEAKLRFPNGVSAEFSVGNLFGEKRRWIEVTGVDGALRYDDLEPTKLVARAGSGPWQPVAVADTPPLSKAVTTFAEYIAQGRLSHESFEVGARVVEVLERIAAKIR